MFEILRRPVASGQTPASQSDAETKSVTNVVVAQNVEAVEPERRRFRAVVTRHVRQVAIVEFDAMEGADQYALGDQIQQMIPDDAWVSEAPGSGWVSEMKPIDVVDATAI